MMMLKNESFSAEQSPKRKRIPIGLQLYSLRDDCKKDLPRVLRAVAEMGYEGVEFAGYYDHKPESLRKLLDDNKLKCCGTHTALDTLTGDALKGTIEFNRVLGNQFLIVPSLPRSRTSSVSALRQTGKLLTELGEKARRADMHVGYHAHAGDFRKIDGQTPWEIIFDEAGPEVVMQLDLGNCLEGGGDPPAVLRKYPRRSLTVHLKEHGGKPGAVIGEGDVQWKQVFQICETTGGTEWYIVEQESYGQLSPLESVRKCLQNLRKMGK